MYEVGGGGCTRLTCRHKKRRCFYLFCFHRKYNYAGSTLFLSMRWEGEVGKGGEGQGRGGEGLVNSLVHQGN